MFAFEQNCAILSLCENIKAVMMTLSSKRAHNGSQPNVIAQV